MKYKTISAKKRKLFELINKKEINHLAIKNTINQVLSKNRMAFIIEDKVIVYFIFNIKKVRQIT